MTAETFEYAIKKDVRNNPIVREVDRERHRESASEEAVNRHLRLEIETLRSPARIERMAKRLRMVAPSADDAIVIERVIQTPAPPRSVVARR
jgi:hypothetical protein